MDLVASVVSDLIAGLVATGIVGFAAVIGRRVAFQTARRLANQLGWPFVASVFFAASLVSAILRGGTVSVAVLGGLLALTASVMLLRFGPARLHLAAPVPVQPVVRFIQAYPWRILAAIFLVASAVLFFTDVEQSTPAVLGERIVFVVDLDDPEMIVFRDVLDELEPELGAEVFLMNVKSAQQVARLDKMVASGDMKWDLIAVDNNMVGVLAAKGVLEKLSDYREYDDIVPKSLLPSLRPLLKLDGEFYFAPFRPNVKVAFYNEEKFAQYALQPPRDWEELLKVARVFKEKEGVGRVAIQGEPGKACAATLFEFVMAAEGNPLTLDDEESREAFAFLKELEPYLAPEYVETTFDTANQLLIDDQVYLVSNWTYAIGVVVEDAGKKGIKAYSGWTGPESEVHVLGGDVLAVPKGSPHPDKAVGLIELLLSKETQQTLLSDLRWVPVRLDAYDAAPPELALHFQAVDEALSSAVLRPTQPQWAMVEKVLDRAFDGLIREGGDMASLAEYSASLKDIPSEYVRYPVKPWDSLEVIATKYNTTPEILAEANSITTRTSVSPGQILLVPPVEPRRTDVTK